jgi:predicted secreted protein
VPAPPPTPAEAIGLDPGPTIPRGMRPAYAPADWQPDPSVVGPLAREQEAAERGALSATQRAEDLRRSAQTALSLGQEQTAAELLAEADALEAQGAEGLRSIEETGIEERPGLTFDDIGDIMPPPAGPGEPPAAGEEITPPARVGNEPPAAGGGETNDPLQELGTQLDQDLRTFFGIEPRDPSSRRAEFDERMSFFQEVFGTRNRNEARDRAMNLAMIGLAIAAGQSPNMLTNIAQGALAGTQAMQRAQAAEQEREEEQRLLVYREMMGEEQEIRRLRQGLGMERFRASLQGVAGGEDTRQEYAYNAALATFLETLVKDIGMDPEAAATRARELAARVAPDAPSAVRARAEAVRTQINQLRAERVPDAEIRRQLVELGVDPTVFGL